MKAIIIIGLLFCALVLVAFLVRNWSDSQNASGATVSHSENQSWVVQRGGDVVEKKAQSGIDELSDWERLMYCLWIADYMMRNAGDFGNSEDMYPDFQKDATHFAERLRLPITREAFSLSRRKLQKEYFDRFEAICDELRGAEPSAASNSRPSGQSNGADN
jgi:hypothetical protein